MCALPNSRFPLPPRFWISFFLHNLALSKFRSNIDFKNSPLRNLLASKSLDSGRTRLCEEGNEMLRISVLFFPLLGLVTTGPALAVDDTARQLTSAEKRV